MIARCQGFCTALGTLMQLYHSLPISRPESDPALALHSEELNAEVIKAISEGIARRVNFNQMMALLGVLMWWGGGRTMMWQLICTQRIYKCNVLEKL